MNKSQVMPRNVVQGNMGRSPLATEFDQVMRHFFGDNLSPSRSLSERVGSDGWVPAWEVIENDTEFRVILDVPGFAPEDVAVELKQDQLTISGHRQETMTQENDRLHLRERRFGKFQRVLAFREPVENDQVSATLNQGVLTVVVPKAKEAQPTKIEIRSA